MRNNGRGLRVVAAAAVLAAALVPSAFGSIHAGVAAVSAQATPPVPPGQIEVAQAAPTPTSPAGFAELVLDPARAAEIEAADPEAGRSYAQRCLGCHAMRAEGDAAGGPQAGPNLFAVFGRRIGSQTGFAYSPAIVALNTAGLTWDDARLDAFLADPAAAVPGTIMAQAILDPVDRANVIAYLRTLVPDPATVAAGGDADLIARIAAADPAGGEAIAARCAVCHSFAAGGEPGIGPNLFGLVGAAVGRADGFAYSTAMRALAAEGAIWSLERLDAFIANPAIALPGTRMGFAGIAGEDERAALLAYLRTLAAEPVPLAAAEPAGPAGIGLVRPDLNPVVFSRGQVAFADRFIEDGECATCHGEFLRGTDAGPQLVGPEFAEAWFNRTVLDLFRFVEGHAAVQNQIAALIVAFVLERNGFRAGEVELPWGDTTQMRGMGFYQ